MSPPAPPAPVLLVMMSRLPVRERTRALDLLELHEPAPASGCLVRTVLFVLPSLAGGGAERVIVNIVNHLDRARFQPILALGAASGPYLSDVHEDVQIWNLGRTRARAALPALARACRHIRPHTVLSTLGMNMAVCAARGLMPRDTRIVLREASSPRAFLADVRRQSRVRAAVYRAAYGSLYSRADAVICPGDFIARDLRTLGVAADRLRRVHNPVDIERVDALACHHETLEPGAPQLVSVGRLGFEKAYDIELRAFAQVRRRHPDARLTIVGDGPEGPALRRLARDLRVSESVTFAGFRQNPYPFMRQADLIVLASRYEGFANVIVEALACGTPVVATDCPSANREVIREGTNGLLAAPEDPSALSEAITAALARRWDRSALRRDCEERFAVTRIVRQYEAVIEER